MLLRLADNAALVTTPTLVAGTFSQQPLDGNGAAMILSALPTSAAAGDEAITALCASSYSKHVN